MSLFISSASLTDFISEANFKKFKIKFLLQDVRISPYELPDDIVGLNEILVEHGDVDNEDYTTYTFGEYFSGAITMMSKKWTNQFRRKIETLYTSPLRNGFLERTQNYFRTQEKAIQNESFLSIGQKIYLARAIREFDDYMLDLVKNPLPEIKSKLEFNLNKNTLVYFFHLLRENKVFEKIADADLGRIIDDRFLFQDTNNYSVPKDSRKLLHGFGDKGTKSSKKAEVILKEIFLNPDFFNI